MSSQGRNDFIGSRGRLGAALFLAFSVAWNLAGAVDSSPASPLPGPQTKKWADQMPEGEGKKLIVAKCQLCHTLERVVTSHRTRDDWDGLIAQMVEQGAALNDAESKTVVDYLATNYSPQGAAATTSAAGAIVDPGQAQFTAPPDSLGLAKGVMMSIVAGDPTKPGLFSVLFKLPANQMIPPHWQSIDVDSVVLRGSYELGNGDSFDATKLQEVNAGELVHIPAQTHQFGRAKAETIVLLYGVGPLSISWGQ